MSLDRIIKLVSPPKSPLHNGSGVDWNEVQRALGCRLPPSLGHYARRYGSGYFDGGHYINIYNPFDPVYHRVIREQCEIYQGLKEESPEWYPYDCLPDKNGIIPIAGSDTGIQFFLDYQPHTQCETVIFDDRSSGYLEFSMPLLDFFFEFLSNRIEEQPYFQGQIVFIPEALIPPGV